MKRRTVILRYILWAAALAAALACYWFYAENTSRLHAAAGNLQRCEELAAQIAGARQAPRRAQLATRSADDLGSIIEKSTAEAQLARDRILRIDPQPARRLGKTDYLEQATEVELVGVSLRQMVEFLYNLGRTDEELNVSTLRLRTPHGTMEGAGAELWLADVVLAQRIYAPATARRD